jgi:predicted transcriptional regulator
MVLVGDHFGEREEKNARMSTPVEKATAYLSKLEDDRAAALAASKEKALEAMIIKAREEGFREAIKIFGLNVTTDVASSGIEVETHERPRRRRRDIRQIIIKELSFSGNAMTTQQIAKAINYLPERTEAALKRLASEGKLIQNRDSLWEVVVVTDTSADR